MYLDANDLPEEVTLSVYPIMTDYGLVMVSTSEIDSYTTIGDSVEVTFKIKTKDVISKELVAGLKDKASKIRASAESECAQIEEKIQSLLALPNNEESNK